MENIKIACPKCSWEPSPDSEWQCGCGHTWNTFDTGGRCPACKHVWHDTQCLGSRCQKWSPHLDWYHGLENVVNTLKEEIEKSRVKEKETAQADNKSGISQAERHHTSDITLHTFLL